ncbi:hypothetical protein [Undibacterium sp. TS12]|uniref:hypothetical protein n=1 Tax=Undibacterium sp. TS12 TaxID=2908202 RepID=UPI001F4CBC75|nr:hypothetical protein [Undibacterium sp. TS12]MCH8622280.1 hypothetical protein [Undibacterium sp. TS12]
MPVTPFHFGLGAALKAAAPRHISFLSFAAVNVFIDVESFYNLMHARFPVHAFFHTYIGAPLMAMLTILLFLLARWCARRFSLINFYHWQQLSLLQVSLGALLGAWSHVLLDSIMHADIRPLHPFSNENMLYEIIPLLHLHLICVLLGVLGLLGVYVRRADEV